MLHIKLNKKNTYKKFKSILLHKNSLTYSHAFHIKINSLKNMNNLLYGIKIIKRMDTRIYQNIFSKLLREVPFLRPLRSNIKFAGHFIHYKNSNNIGNNFSSRSSIFRDINDDVKNICEELLQARILSNNMKRIIK